MPEGWAWDPTLFAGTAAHYERGRLPYPSEMRDAFAGAADLRGAPRLLDVGCGPGSVARPLADLFVEVVGVDPDPDMLDAAARHGVPNARWVRLRGEELPAGLGRFRYATFGRSFHWMDRAAVAAIVFDMLEPGGAFVHVDARSQSPSEDLRALTARYLGDERRAGAGVLRHGTPGDEWGVLRAAGFEPPVIVAVPGDGEVERSADDMVSWVLSQSATAPHLFGDRLADFERDLRKLLGDGPFRQRPPDTDLVFYRRP